VLLVDDEQCVRNFEAVALRRQGYLVLEASSGEEALQIASDHGGNRIQLLLTDVVMPRMGGRELTRRLLVQYPCMKVLSVSALDKDDIAVVDPLVPAPFLQKPFSVGELAHKVREALDSDPAY
jgi:DNA-binding response OmpR family regulator